MRFRTFLLMLFPNPALSLALPHAVSFGFGLDFLFLTLISGNDSFAVAAPLPPISRLDDHLRIHRLLDALAPSKL